MSGIEMVSCSSDNDLAARASEAWISEIARASRAGKPHCVALSGGRIARKFFTATVHRIRTGRIGGGDSARLLDHVHFFWADERCVPPTDGESNFRMADELLFRPLGVSAGRIHRICGEESPEVAAEKAAAEISRIVPLKAAGQPALDLILLGLGEDGHVASLFPGESEAVASGPEVYRSVHNSPKPPLKRVTLGYAAIAAAGQVWMLASGGGKAAALGDAVSPAGNNPFARVLRSRSGVTVFRDF